MISSPKTPAPAATLGNVDPKRVASNEQSLPIPYFAGRTWLPLIWAQSNIYNPKTTAVTTKVGKSKQVTGYDYYGSLVGVTSCCIVDYLEGIEVAGKLVWSGTIERDGAHVHHSGDIVVAGLGTFRFYWGTPDQPADDLVLATCGEDHPRYLDQGYLVVKDLLFGNNNATPPTIRVLVERAARFAGMDESRTREGSNPVTAIAEMIGNDFFGLGMPEVIHVASAAATATAVRRDTAVPVPGDAGHVAAMGFISPLLTRQQSAQAFFAQILEYYDGWVRPIDGQLYFGRFPHDGVTPVGLPELSYHDFVTRPRFEPAEDDELITEVNVVHLDRDGENGEMEKVVTPVPNPAARRRLGIKNPRTFQRPFICTTYQAREQGNQLARHYSRDEEACSVSIRRERVVGLHAGDRFVLVDAPSASSQVVRITNRSDSADGGEVELSLVLERGLAPLAYIPPPNPRPVLPDPALVAIVNARIFQLPTLFDAETYGAAPAVVVLAQRPGAHVAGYSAHFSTDNVSYDEIATDGRWALRGTLAAAVAAGDGAFTVNASGFELALLAAQSNAERDDDTLLLFVGFEICSIGNVVALGGGQYTVNVLRGRRGSSAAGYAGGTAVYIMPRAELQVLQHASFPRSIANRHFKLASYTRDEEQELAAALYILFAFDDTNVDPPGGLAAAGKAEAITVSWTYPNPAEPTILATDLWIRSAAVPAPTPGVDAPDQSLLATYFDLIGLAAGTTRYIWAQNRDTIGSRSSLQGPVNATALANTAQSTASTALTTANGKNKIFYQASAPAAGMSTNDEWFDTDDNFKLYVYNGAAWVASFQPMIRLDGSNNITGLIKADGTDKDFILIADKFQVWNGVSAEVPFEIVSGNVRIKNLMVQSVDAGKITAGSITVALELTSGSLKAASGTNNEVMIDSSGLRVGLTSGNHVRIAEDGGVANIMLKNSSGTTKGSFKHASGFTTLDGGGDTNSIVTGFDFIYGNKLRAQSSANPGATTDAPLYCAGGAYVVADLHVGDDVYCNGIRYAGLSGNRISWSWDGANVRAYVDGSLQGTVPNP